MVFSTDVWNVTEHYFKYVYQGWKLAPATSQMRVILCCGG